MEIKCPTCGSEDYVKAGLIAKEKQRYKCLNCKRRFNDLSRTVFHGQKLSGRVMRKLFALIIRDATIEDIVELLGVSIITAYVWRIKVYKCLGNYQKSVVLSGNVWIDEFFIPVNRKDLIMNKEKNYKVLA